MSREFTHAACSFSQSNGVMRIEYCKTTAMLADPFTMALPPETFTHFKTTMLGELHKKHDTFHRLPPSAAA